MINDESFKKYLCYQLRVIQTRSYSEQANQMVRKMTDNLSTIMFQEYVYSNVEKTTIIHFSLSIK